MNRQKTPIQSALPLALKSALLLALISSPLATGCRNLKVNDKPNAASAGIVLPKAQMESDSVAVRVAIAEFDDHQEEELESFIDSTDQKLPLATRQRLDDNGLRVSIVSNINSVRLQGLLAPRIPKREWLTDHELELAEAGKLEPTYRLTSQRHVEKRRGESFTAEVSPVRAESTWQVYEGTRAVPGRAALAQCQMRITSWPQSDGSVRIQFLPEIHHGQKQSKIGVAGQNFSVNQQREIQELRSLSFELAVRPGETILVAPTEKLERIGKLFFDATPSPPELADGSAPSTLAGDSVDPVNEEHLNELFPILEEEQSMDASVLVELDALDEEIHVSDRPQPMRRLLLVRVAEVTPPVIR